jgi:predicted ATPase/DNA-binding winged helix-turn-helix (wHTH) protein
VATVSAVTDTQLQLGAVQIDLEARTVTRADGQLRLTPIEAAVLRYLYERSGEVVSRRALLTDVWGYADTVKSRTVYTTVNRLRAKIEAAANAPEHLLTAGRQGYRLVVERARTGPATSTLPRPADRFVGREVERARIAGWLGQGERLVTVTGPGGAGKTRLALEVGASLAGAVHFVELAHCTTTEAMQGEVCTTLGLGRSAPLPLLADALAGSTLILDNAEQANEACAALVDALRSRCDARFVVTSRVRLRLSDEQLVELSSLGAEDGLALLQARCGVPLPASELKAAAALVQALDGLPLAIEIAAARTRLIGPSQLLERWSALDLGRRGGGPARHASLRATLDGSWALLGAAQRAALAQLSVFRGGFTLAGCEAVLALPGGQDAVDAVEHLLDHSLLAPMATRGTGLRFRLFSAVAAYAAERLPQADPVGGRHAQWLAAGVCAPGQPWLRVAPELGNLHAALIWALETEKGALAGRLAVTAGWCAAHAGPDPALLPLLERAFGVADPHDAVLLATHLAYLLAASEQEGRALGVLDRAEQLLAVGVPWRQHDLSADVVVEAYKRADIGTIRAQILFASGDREAAAALTRQALGQMREAGRPADVARITAQLAGQLLGLDRLQEALSVARDAVELQRSQGDPSHALGHLALVHTRLGDLGAAAAGYREAAAEATGRGHRHLAALQRARLGNVLALAGALDEADAVSAEAIEALGAAGTRAWQLDGFAYRARVLAATGRHEEARSIVAPLLRVGGGHRAFALGVLADGAHAKGSHDEAAALASEALELLQGASVLARATALARLGGAEVALGAVERARARLQEGRALVAGRGLLPAAEPVAALAQLERLLHP